MRISEMVSLNSELEHLEESMAALQKKRVVDKAENKLTKLFSGFFKRQGKLFLEQFEIYKDRFAQTLFPVTESVSADEIRLILQQLNPTMLESIKTELIGDISEVSIKAMAQTMSNLGITSVDVSFALKNPRAVEFLDKHAAELVTGIDETTRSNIATIVTNGTKEGLSYDKVAKQITEKYVQFAIGKPQLHIDSRAHLVAVTESAMAYESGSREIAGYIQTQGLEMEKSWLTVGDDKVSDGCEENQSEDWIPIDSSHLSGDDTPPRFPGCRCSELYRHKPSE